MLCKNKFIKKYEGATIFEVSRQKYEPNSTKPPITIIPGRSSIRLKYKKRHFLKAVFVFIHFFLTHHLKAFIEILQCRNLSSWNL